MQLVSAIIASAATLFACAQAKYFRKYNISSVELNKTQALAYCYQKRAWLAPIDDRNLADIEEVMYKKGVVEVRAGQMVGFENENDPFYSIILNGKTPQVEPVADDVLLRAVCLKYVYTKDCRKKTCKRRRSSRKRCGRRSSYKRHCPLKSDSYEY